MKKVLFLMLSLFVTSLMCVSCGDDEDDLNPSGSGSIVGTWVPTEDREEYISFYWEFTKTEVRYYELNRRSWDDDTAATFKDGYVYVPAGYSWKLVMVQPYKINNGNIFVNGINVGSVKFISKNKAIFDSPYLVDGVCERVKGFK